MFRSGFAGLPGILLGLVILQAGVLSSAARAQGVSSQASGPMSGSCSRDNLLSGKVPSHLQDLRGNARLVTDGAVAPEGAQWDAPVAVVLDTGAGSITYDLGQATPITALYIQADANDTYKIQGSLDGTPGSFKLLVDIDNASDRGHGLRARSVQIPPMAVRFLRVGEGVGDGYFSISEFAAYCQVPIPFPPVMRQSDAPLAAVTKRPWYKFDWWEDHASARLEMGIALFALVLLAWGYRAEKTGKDIRLSDSAPSVVAALSIAIHLTFAVSISVGTNWVPTWAAILACYLSCEFTLLVTPLPAGVVTPMAFLIKRWRARRGDGAPGPTVSATSATKTDAASSTTDAGVSTTDTSVSTTDMALSTTDAPVSTTAAPVSPAAALSSVKGDPAPAAAALSSIKGAPASAAGAPSPIASVPSSGASVPSSRASVPSSGASVPTSGASVPSSVGAVAVRGSRASAAVRNQLLVLVGILSFFAYWNFGAFHFGNYTHYWDTYHYYVGSKYFNEMSYDRLYDCASVADSEDPSLRRRVELRKIMDLRTNVLGSTTEVLAHPERCKQHFSPERWQKFKKDIEFFRNRHGVKRWEEAQTDHGYNATPVWNILGTALANLSPASDRQLWWLTRIDPAFIFGIALMIWWAFGWRVLCVALAVFATNFPSRFYWTGGAYLRWDWLFHMTAGVCLIKKNRPIVGGYLVAYSALLRVFPGFMFLGPVFVIVQQLLGHTKGRPWWKRLPGPRELPVAFRRVDRGHLAVILGAVLAGATLVPLSLVVSNGVDGYKMFLQNSKKHTSTPLTNYMGWRTVITYKEQEAGRYLRTDRLEDPWKDWKDARLRTFHHRTLHYVLGILAFTALLFIAVRGMAPWEATALSSLMIAVVPELTCYYYSFLIVLALLWAKRQEVGLALLGATAATGFIDWAPTQFLPKRFPWAYIQMPTWLDEQYTWMSAATLVAIGYILYEFGFVSRPTPAVTAPVSSTDPAGKGSGGASAAGGGALPKGGGKSSRRRQRR